MPACTALRQEYVLCLPDDRHTITVLKNGKNPGRRHSAARPKVSGKTAFFRETTGRMV